MRERSQKNIELKHLQHLEKIVSDDQKDYFKRFPKYEKYKTKRYALLLIQGAAQHYVDDENGIKDFDVLVLYEKTKTSDKLYPRRIKSYNSGLFEFGRCPDDDKKYKTRRVDILMREIKIDPRMDFSENIERFMKAHPHWKKKPAVGIWPEYLLGEIIYNTKKKA